MHGQRRAPCAVAVYLMQVRGYSAEDALALVYASIPDASYGVTASLISDPHFQMAERASAKPSGFISLIGFVTPCRSSCGCMKR